MDPRTLRQLRTLPKMGWAWVETFSATQKSWMDEMEARALTMWGHVGPLVVAWQGG